MLELQQSTAELRIEQSATTAAVCERCQAQLTESLLSGGE